MIETRRGGPEAVPSAATPNSGTHRSIPMTRMTPSEAFVETMVANGVTTTFGIMGSAFMDAMDIFTPAGIRLIPVVHEQGATHMADGYARASGQVSFVNLQIETGLANGLSLLHNAHEGGTPIVVTSANKDVRKLAEGRSDLSEMVRLFTKWSVEVTDPTQIPAVMRRAFTEAKTPPTGPVYIGFSANALDSEADMEIIPSPQG